MQTDNKFLDDLAKLATGAAGALHGVRGEMEAGFRAWLDRQLAGMDLVTRQEFEVVKSMASEARRENELLRKEIEALRPSAPKAAGAPKKAASTAKAATAKAKPAAK